MSDYTLIAVFTVMEGTFTVTADYCGKYIFVQSLHYTTMKNPIKVSIAIIMTSLVILSGLSLMVLTDEYTNQSKEYTPIGDMDDYIANNSSRSQESIQYNTVYNVTHWSPDTGVVRLPTGETNSCVLSETEYADPYEYVQISQETVWSNYDADDSLINKEITLLVKGGGRIFIGGTPSDESYLLPIWVSNFGTRYFVQNQYIGNYVGLRITISAESDTMHVQGILSESKDFPTYAYNVDSKSFEFEYPSEISSIYRLKFVPTSQMRAYIEETAVLFDPYQYLWADADVDMTQYFSGLMDKMGIRLYNVAYYGSSITVNGQSFEVSSGKISVGEDTYELEGLLIEYSDGRVFIGDSEKRSDLGELSEYHFKLNGLWHFNTVVYLIEINNVSQHRWFD